MNERKGETARIQWLHVCTNRILIIIAFGNDNKNNNNDNDNDNNIMLIVFLFQVAKMRRQVASRWDSVRLL